MKNAQDIYPSIYNKLINQFNILRQNYSKLLNIRVDFHYSVNQPSNIKKAYIDMISLYNTFKFNNEGVIGYQFIMEHSKAGTLHIHALFFINGQKHQKYYPFYLWLNDFWLNKTHGASHTVDCNNASSYKHPIVGNTKSYHDDSYVQGIIYLAQYFAKKEQKDNIPYVYCYFVSFIKTKTRRGRPREQAVKLLPLMNKNNM